MTVKTTTTYSALIGGELRQARSGQTLDATSPATGELLGRFPRCTADDVADAVDAARAAYPEWRRLDPEERAGYLLRIADIVHSHGDELAELDSRDNGSPFHEMRKDIGIAVRQLRYFAGLALQIRGQTIPAGHDRLNYTLRQPFGVVGRIIPFNHPVMFTAAKIAAPLMAGNTVVIKPSEHTSLSALRLAEHLRDVIPPGVLSVVPGLGSEAGDALVIHPDVPRLAFIGAADTGRAIVARAAGVALKHVTLELGGKNPLVVFADAAPEDAVQAAVNGMNFTWQGQSCGSTSRLLIQRERYDEFVEALGERINGLASGDPLDPDTDTGAIVNERQLSKVLDYVALGREEGARLVVGGQRVSDGRLGEGLFVRPALFADVRPDSRLAQEEIFGPVLAAMPFDDYPDAVRIANGIRYGLTAAVYTRDIGRALSFARDVEAGYVWVNETSRHVAGTSFGGMKDSGLGREEDLEELESYTQSKNVHVRFA